MVQDALLSLLEKSLDQTLYRCRLADLPWAAQGVHALQADVHRIERGRIPVERATLERADMGIALDRSWIAPPGVEVEDLGVWDGQVTVPYLLELYRFSLSYYIPR